MKFKILSLLALFAITLGIVAYGQTVTLAATPSWQELPLWGTQYGQTPIFFGITSAKTYNLYIPRITRIVGAEYPHQIIKKKELSAKDIRF